MKVLVSYVRAVCVLMLLSSSGVNAQDNAYCGNAFVNPRGWGPFDYLDPMEHANQRHIPTLEKHHFGPDVRAGRRGMSGKYDVIPDLDFILRACPNHHPALSVVLKHHVKKRPQVAPDKTAECYIQRAVQFRPDDGTVRMLAGIYYARSGVNDKALEAYSEGLALLPDSAELHYNIGLLYTKLGRLHEANEHAVRAYMLGAQLPGLKRKLIRLDAWNPDIVEPEAVNPVAENDEQPG